MILMAKLRVKADSFALWNKPMQKTKQYPHTIFSADVIKQARDVLDRETGHRENDKPGLSLTVTVDGARWAYDSEDEFFADYRRASGFSMYSRRVSRGRLRVGVTWGDTTEVEVEALDRSGIERVFEVFERHLGESRVPEPPVSSERGRPLKKRKEYRRTRFAVDVIKEARDMFDNEIGRHETDSPRRELDVEVDGANWSHNSEDEFFSDYRLGDRSAVYQKSVGEALLRISIVEEDVTIVTVAGNQRSKIEAVFEVFEKHSPESLLPDPPKPRQDVVVFIGHGHNSAWRDLKDHLQDKHGFKIEAYEVGARAGHSVRDILEGMLGKSSIAFLVMTAEDMTGEGSFRARQNVVHEIGLFQGRLGFPRGIILLEDGVEEFSNVSGIEQIRFGAGRIKETFGEVVATIRREFPAT